jgi:hypothetical protein
VFGNATYSNPTELFIDVNHRSPRENKHNVERPASNTVSILHTPFTSEPDAIPAELPIHSPLDHIISSRSSGHSYRRLDTESGGNVVMRPLHLTNTATSAHSAQPSPQPSPVPSPPQFIATATSLGADPNVLSTTLRNPNHYYYDCSGRLLGVDRFEDDLYAKPAFRVFVAVLPICVWAGVTIAAIFDWAI